jgi:molybdopterin-guanine dinucleotide biosynthesis protein A
MGTDKAFVAYLGVPMALCVATALRGAGCESIVAVGGDAPRLHSLGFDVVADGWPGEGPMGGVATALKHFAAHDVVVAVACDLPLLTAATVEALVTHLAEAPTAIAAVAVTDRVQPLCVAWRPTAFESLQAALLAGDRRLQDLLARLPIVKLSVNPQDLQNVNTPSDLPK